ncbi:MAG: TetR/AcrR family transcriptional regulator [Paracoccaceae bacterium]|nr:MAG: TetR/AcrR family transcriptional regulator [Paracoccaceae bacterium]
MTHDTDDRPTRERLTEAAALLFRRQGYHATGVAEILAVANAPKGSLYHHFPEGKSDLARAAADWTADLLIRIIDDAFGAAVDWRHGISTLCHKLAKLFDLAESANACPISALLFDGPDSDAFRAHADAVFTRLAGALAGHARRLHQAAPEAKAETLLIMIEGGWTLARARRQSDVLRRLPDHLHG